jgi:Zn-dependent peptidase ImmA (M78 family)
MTHIPFLEPSFIEAKANQILNTAKAEGLYDGNSHTPLDTICELQLGLQYIYLNLETTHNGEDISGFVNFQNRTVVLNNIEFSDSYHKGRINFTIAHEIGHWILHKSYMKNT